MNTIQLETAHTSGVYAKRAVVMVRGQGARLWDENGREYIDCAACPRTITTSRLAYTPEVWVVSS